jgi:glycosyltransferase involved in cell wall biosynthesis
MTSVSVVIPCYNYGHYLRDAVSSVLDDQAGVDVRVLIIDDASPDNSGEIARKIAARDSRVEVIVHSANKGHIATYNEGLLEWAAGDYCVLMSADDRLVPGALQRAKDLLDAHPSVGFVYGRSVWFNDGAKLPAARTTLRGWSVWPGQEWLAHLFRQAENPITAPEVVVRTSLQRRLGGYDPRLPHAADMEMWMRLAANADVGFLRGVDQAYYRLHQQNMRKSYDALMDLRQKRLVYETVLDRYGERVTDARRLSAVVHRQLSKDALWAAARAYDRGRTGETPVSDLVRFALECWPPSRRLTGYRTLRLRQIVGPRVMPFLQPFIVSAIGHMTLRWWRRRNWKRRGY